ncbi:MAG: hypothetical protein JXO22_04975 [Phycisphaerae bacterium]|nr:hypothetical protein [Phycisphaerae bacterium]
MRLKLTLCAAAALLVMAGAAHAQLTITDQEPGQFIDISQTGFGLGLAHDDEAIISTTISNAVFPAGDVHVGNNGGIAFGTPLSADLGPVNQPLPSSDAFGGSQVLLGYWDDIGNTIGDVYWMDQSDRLIIQWESKQFEDSTDTLTFQMQIFQSRGTRQAPIYAQIIFADIEQPRAGGGASATIGYQDGVGGSYNDVQWSFDTPGAVSNGMVLSLIPEPATLLLIAAALPLLRRRAHRP